MLFGRPTPRRASASRVRLLDHAYGDADDDSPEVRFAELLEEVRTA